MQPLVSVVVPIYKVEHCLRQCLDSLCRQSLADIEILLIDDASPDYSSAICDEYATIDTRFRVFHNSRNLGLSVARNIGIVNASASYVMFVDGDDYVHEDFCKSAYESAVRCQADLVMFRYQKIDKMGKALRTPISDKTRGSGTKTRIEAVEMMLHDIGSWAWNKLYKRELFEGISYPPGYKYEDLGTTYKLIWKAKRVYYLDKVLYYYCYHSGSITTMKTKKGVQDSFEMQLQQYRDLVAYGFPVDKLESVLLNLAVSYCMMAKPNFTDNQYAFFADVLQRCQFRQSELKWKRKILVLLYKYIPVLFELICVLSGRKFDYIPVSYPAASDKIVNIAVNCKNNY